MAKLTEKQKRFIDYFIELGNATEAALRAGYSKKTAHVIGAQNLSKLRPEIDRCLAEKDAERIASQDEVLEYLTSVLRGEVSEEVPLLCGDGWQKLGIKGTSIKDRLKAAELLGKRHGLFTDKLLMEGVAPVTIVDDLRE